MRTIAILLCFIFALSVSAQTKDESRISIKAVIPDDIGLTSDAYSYLVTKMQRLLIDNGYADNSYAERFVLTSKADVTSKDIIPSSPARVSLKIDVTFLVGDVIENKIYASSTLPVAGIGINENKALISAFNKINSNNQKLKDMLTQAKTKIVEYYADNCEKQISKAKTLAGMGRYDEAICNMMSVPNICSDCFNKCQDTALDFYQQKIDKEGKELLEKAYNVWMINPNADGAKKVVPIIENIPIGSSVYPKVDDFRKEITDKLNADEKKDLEKEQRDWNFKMKQYNDAQGNKQMLIKACKEVGVAWAKNQPKSITKNIIRAWL